ncbi:MAG: choice-of-anchor B family protein [Flavobacteriaceae bacterium]|nr:choice-of-anchor B family protein [Flavobacteriaceae bacterium]
MKKITSLLMIFSTAIAFAQTPCSGGNAAGYPCNGYDLQSNIPLGIMGAQGGNDSWGWTDPQDGKEYAIIGLNNGTAFVDIDDPNNPIYLGKLPTHTSSTIWRDMKVIGNHVYIVSEAGGHGMQIFDLTRLRSVASPPETFTEDGHYNGFGSAHNIVSNPDTGYVYPVGTSLFNGGPVFINVNDPLNPILEGGYSMSAYSHDAQIVTYNGPDTEHVGKEIMIGSNEDEVVIVDITDKLNPVELGSTNYPSVSYTHQGWFTEDQRYFLVGDEGDELDFGFNTRTIVFDLEDLDNPFYDFEYLGPTGAIDHNGYVVGDKYYLANYAAGLRVLDISDIANQNMTEIGFFDSYPQNNNTNYSGAWNVYPFFASGNIIISGDSGMTIAKVASLGTDDFANSKFAMYPNPTENIVTISSESETISKIDIYNILGQNILSRTFGSNLSETLNISELNSGVYLVTINDNTTKRLVVK